MNDAGIRTLLVEALESANVISMRTRSLTPTFLAGEDVSLDSLDMDSLAVMELCIAIEVNTGVSVAPDELDSIATMNRLVTCIRERAAS